jgi:hypothetical protein
LEPFERDQNSPECSPDQQKLRALRSQMRRARSITSCCSSRLSETRKA